MRMKPRSSASDGATAAKMSHVHSALPRVNAW